MNELDKLIAKLIKEKGGSRNDYLKLLDAVAYHESAGTMDSTIVQKGGGPGRGKYQFEAGKNAGGITAAKRTKQFYKDNDMEIPEWLDKAASGDSLDVSSLSSEQQDELFLGNMRKHPKADLGKVVNGEESIGDFWLKYHWAGPSKDKAERASQFADSMKSFSKKFDYDKLPKSEGSKTSQSNAMAVLNKSPRIGSRENEDGSNSTHLMASGEADNSYVAYPTLYQDENQKWYSPEDSYAEALKKKELYKFSTQAEAENFAKGDWKVKDKTERDLNNKKAVSTSTYTPSIFLQNKFANGGLSRSKDYGSKSKPYPSVSKGDFAGGGRSYPIPTKADAVDALRLAGLHGRSDVRAKVFSKYPELKSNKKELGGSLPPSVYTSQSNIFGAGGTHGQNPNGGVRVGKDANGTWNTVEQNEASFNFEDGKYIFSNRF